MRAILVLSALLAIAAPAGASDAQLRFVIHRYERRLESLGHHVQPHGRAVAHYAVRIARMSRRTARWLAHIPPSTTRGATARHLAVGALREIRIGARLLVLAVSAPGGAAEAYANRGFARFIAGAASLANAQLAF